MRLIHEHLYNAISKVLLKLGIIDISHYINGPEHFPYS